jgi:prephenate dehydrogenase
MEQWEKITLVGVGLLGGSLGLAIKQCRLARWVTGYVRHDSRIAECEKVDVVDEVETDLQRAVEDSELVILCTPIAEMGSLAAAMAPALRAGCLVTDVGSVKRKVVSELEPLYAAAGTCFVGSHPMAGGEKTGVTHARANLFNGAVCAITPTQNCAPQAVDRVEAFWMSVGARTLRLSADRHDELVSRASHLPHVVAAALAGYILDPVHPDEQRMLCARGFGDTTRIASGSPQMWRDICLANRADLSRSLIKVIKELHKFERSLADNDAKSVEEFLHEAKERRDAWRAQATDQ